MSLRNGNTRVRWAAAAALVVALAACDWNDPDEIQNSSNFAVVRAQFFASSTSRTPVAGVRMIVEADADSERPYNGPDAVGISGQDGVATTRVFTGLTQQQQQGGGGGGGGGGQQQQTGPRNPLELPAPLFFGDAAVTLIYNGQIVSLIGGGLTIGNGRIYDLGTVFLADYGVVAD
jgi:hypothetical protein